MKDGVAKDILKSIFESFSNNSNEEAKVEVEDTLKVLETASDEEIAGALDGVLESMSDDHPVRRPPLFTKYEVVKDVLENMDFENKAKVKHTRKDELIMFHRGWGTSLRNYYLMWHNEALLKDIGKDHPHDASMVIIEEVWEKLQQSEEKGLESPPQPPEIEKNVFLQWLLDKECLEISCSGKSVVIANIKMDFAEAIAKALKVHLIRTRTTYVRPDVAPRVTGSIREVLVTLRKYPKYRAEGEIEREVSTSWLTNEQRLDISCGGAIIAIEGIDFNFAQSIANGMRTPLIEKTEFYVDPDVAPRVTHRHRRAAITLWTYPQHPDNK